jgi:hypothetical protein
MNGRTPFPEDRHRRSKRSLSMSAYLRQLSYRRIFFLTLAAVQFFPLPDPASDVSRYSTVPKVRIFPELFQS